MMAEWLGKGCFAERICLDGERNFMEYLQEVNDVIGEEFIEFIQKRRKREPRHPYFNPDDGSPVNPKKEAGKEETTGKKKKDDKQKCKTLIGLALSGGGIRSAATNLGLLQGLSESEVLPLVDYLSTVSGGGYIGACLSSLLSNKKDASKGKAYEFDANPEPLFSTHWENFPFRQDQIEKKDDNRCGRVQMEHVRTRASYLATQARHFSPTVTRAVGSVFISTFMSLLWFLLVTTIITSLYMWIISIVAPALEIGPDNGGFSLSVAAQVSGKEIEQHDSSKDGLKIVSFATQLTGNTVEIEKDKTASTKDALKTIAEYAKEPFQCFKEMETVTRWIIGLSIVALGIIFSMLVAVSPWLDDLKQDKNFYNCFLIYLGILLVVLVSGRFVLPFVVKANALAQGAILVVPPLFAGGALIGAWLAYVWFARDKKRLAAKEWNIANRSDFHKLTGILFVGLLLTLVWTILPGFMCIGTGTFNTLLLVVLGVGIRYAIAGKNSKQEKKGKIFSLRPKYKEWLLDLCTLVFIFLVVVYAGNVLREILLDGKWPAVDASDPVDWLLLTGGISLGLLAIFSLLVDVNKISSHYFYRDRLAEAFLQTRELKNGCLTDSVKSESEDEIFLRNDVEMRLNELHGTEGEECAARGPYLLMNATLNLTASKDLKAFNRKSDIFTFSRLYVGSEKTGFIKTDAYMVDGGTLKLARAMAISGAAVTSVMGMNTSLAQSFVCTVFGVRLGYWLKNFKIKQDKNNQLSKARKTKDREKLLKEIKQLDSASSFFICNFCRMFRELVGHTTSQEEEIYLSDGGHSGDNLGIIPLLQRRVKVLLVSDSECDPNHSFDSFNNSVRNAYVDEGIKIIISLDGLRKDEKGFTKDRFAVGRIIYPEQDKTRENWLVLFKNTMNGREPCDIVNYKEKSSTFPHETTGDQFFTEEQFESYRWLGRFTVQKAFESRRNWRKACLGSSRNAHFNCEDVYNFLCRHRDSLKDKDDKDEEKSAMRYMQE
jgi:hypothetical protein